MAWILAAHLSCPTRKPESTGCNTGFLIGVIQELIQLIESSADPSLACGFGACPERQVMCAPEAATRNLGSMSKWPPDGPLLGT